MTTNKKIVVIDDSRTARQQVSDVLLPAGYQVIEAVDGADGLEKVLENADASLVICDVNMPVRNGLDLLRSLRDDHPETKVPVIMLTTEAQVEMLREAKAVGARGWIVKPFKPEMLLSAVKRLLGEA